jgi:hypothetical protein
MQPPLMTILEDFKVLQYRVTPDHFRKGENEFVATISTYVSVVLSWFLTFGVVAQRVLGIDWSAVTLALN